MNIIDKSFIYWKCRRGILELEIIIMSFVKNRYDLLTNFEKDIFIELINNDDFILLNWLMDYNESPDPRFKSIIKTMKQNNDMIKS